MAEAPLLELRGITKRFPGVLANDRITFDLRPGEVHALLGENGAGKSTLMNILYGLYTPDEGQIVLHGKPIDLGSTKAAIEHGIGMVHQHFMLIPVMTVAENIVLATEPRRAGVLLDVDAANRRVRELSDRYGLAVDPEARVDRITVGQQQRVEILKALYRGAEVLILDEPTAVLTPQESQELFEIIRSLKTQGKSIIFISHKLNEVLEIADRITVLRRGKTIDTIDAAGATEEGLARLMVGREVLLRVDKQAPHPGDPLLVVEHLSVIDDRGLEAVRDVSFEVRSGEIVGLAGVDANGQSELIDAIAGLRSVESGRVLIDGADVTGDTAREMLDAGLGHIPEDRHRRGLVLPFSLTENLALHEYRKAPNSKLGLLSPRRMVARARKLLEEFDVRGGTPATPAGALSGGNQQKVVIAREVDKDPKVLIAAQPTRGLDVGAIEFVHRRLVEQRDTGRAVFLVSLELEEILSLSDRILVIYEGRIVGEFPPSATEEELGFAMTGGRRHEAGGVGLTEPLGSGGTDSSVLERER
ncbi:MAG TPA: ABC transporter ATP-binding protein [Gaiellaceae bacterium]